MKKTIILILLAILFVGSLGAVAAHQTNFLDLSPVFAKIPLLHGLVKQAVETSGDILVSPIEEENKRLRAENNELLSKITSFEGEKTTFIEQITELQNEVNKLTNEKIEQEAREMNTQKLASYYREMKPDAAAKIMENLDDETIILILALLEKKQAGQIIATMDSQRAALITSIILGGSS